MKALCCIFAIITLLYLCMVMLRGVGKRIKELDYLLAELNDFEIIEGESDEDYLRRWNVMLDRVKVKTTFIDKDIEGIRTDLEKRVAERSKLTE